MKLENVVDVEKNLFATNIPLGSFVKVAHVKKIKYIGKEDTYNMEVKDTHNFIANGIIVHNSIDATRYCMIEFVDTGRCPIV